MKPFLILQLRPEDEASDDEYAAFLRFGGLEASRTLRIRLDRDPLPELRLSDFAGTIVGGGPGCVSDAPADKTATDARAEAACLSLMPQITEGDLPFLGCCYGIGILGHHLGAEVSKARFGEPVSAARCTVTDAGRADPLLADLPPAFDAFVGHKEALQNLPRGATHLLAGEACPFQMIRYGANVYATQFHPEADGDGFATRIRIYRNKGYFPPDDAAALTEMVRAADVTTPPQILRNFVARYGT
ncbi:glutamine amidotransferase [Thalassorhabdomicrobium marinisediminis]|uniref:Glutamine amidotransferase n=1 Tax=Thalassorhabdomicrobium marinisediminis TaxID=2170577 RepID=A0A2T7FXH5_9RHOB|nr:glutamine amidotransferase [Thalassorhabdomicrobium marinisediminis]PVA06872.1 glutamine amidotransferase [Thalassorhabdomicrobium marinisediminis]